MAFNYAFRLSKVIKVEVNHKDELTRRHDHQRSADIGAMIYGHEPAQIETLWLKEGLHHIDRNELEKWMIDVLQPFSAASSKYRNEWFYATEHVLLFLKCNPYRVWISRVGRSETWDVTKIEDWILNERDQEIVKCTTTPIT